MGITYSSPRITFTDAATDRVNCNIAGGSVTWPTIYATFVYWNFTATGIANDFTYISAPDNTSVTAIKAVTDEITITDGLVHGDVKKQNGVLVYGTGITTDKWRGTP